MTDVLLITGPTAVGKTETAVEVAEALGGEVISADSRQVYKYLDIGSAKPDTATLARVKHHLVSVLEPYEAYNAGDFARDAEDAARDIESRGRIPVVCGGATLYLKALTEGLFREPDNLTERLEFRTSLTEEVKREGIEPIYEKLCEVDEKTASRLECTDTQRIVRALEVFLSTGIPLSDWHSDGVVKPDIKSLSFCLDLPREELAGRIEKRTRQMMADGLLEEVKGLMDRGLQDWDVPLKSVGYSEIIGYLKGDLGLDEALDLINRNTKRYAKRQITWFRKMRELTWLDSGSRAAEVITDAWKSRVERSG